MPAMGHDILARHLQATHFVDLMRYIGGDVLPDTVVGAAVGPEYPLSDAAALAPEGEAHVSCPQELAGGHAFQL